MLTEAEDEAALAHWFEKRGFEVRRGESYIAGNKVDLIAHSSAETWIVEAKGDYTANASQYQTNLDTAFGQLLKSTVDVQAPAHYALGLPLTSLSQGDRFSFRRPFKKYSHSAAFRILDISLLMVSDDNSVRHIASNSVAAYLATL